MTTLDHAFLLWFFGMAAVMGFGIIAVAVVIREALWAKHAGPDVRRRAWAEGYVDGRHKLAREVRETVEAFGPTPVASAVLGALEGTDDLA